jgi:hypothetical protein
MMSILLIARIPKGERRPGNAGKGKRGERWIPLFREFGIGKKQALAARRRAGARRCSGKQPIHHWLF